MHAPSPDVFQTDAWFEHLLACGFVHPPSPHVLALPGAAASAVPPRLHLVSHADAGPLSALSNYYTGLYGPTGAYSCTAAQWKELAQRMRALPGSAVIRLQPLDAEGHFIAGMAGGLRAAGYWADQFFCFGNWYLPVHAGGFTAYWAQRPAALRHTVERAQRRLDRRGDATLHVHRDDADGGLRQAIDAYEAVYAQSWKDPEPNPGFMPGLIRLAARQGWLRLGVLRLAGEPVAAQVWLVCAGKANIFKLAYVPGHERLSVGSVLTAFLMRHAMEFDGVHEIDYLSGDDNYKKDWMSHRRERLGLVAFDPRRVRGLLAGARHFAGRLKRAMWRP